MSTPNGYQLIDCTHSKVNSNCKLCGVFLKNGVQGYKTERYRNSDQAYTIRYLRSLKKQLRKPLIGKYPSSESLYSYLERLIEKFEFGMETLALGIYIFNCLYQKDRGNEKQYQKRMNLYAGVSVMIAAKAIELDKKVPYYSRFQKYADTTFTKQEYEELESELLAKMEFNVQIPTFVTFLNYYLSNGLLFSDDLSHKKNAFVIEEKVKELTFKSLKSGEYISKNQEKLAASIIIKARKEFHLGWNQCIQDYSLMSASECQDEMVLLPISFQSVNNLTNNVMSHSINRKNIILNRPQPVVATKMKYVHSRSVNSSLGIMSMRSRDL